MQTVEGGPEQIFFCKRKAGFEKRNWKIEPDASCPNFYSPQVNQAEIKDIEKTGAKVILLTQGKYAIVDERGELVKDRNKNQNDFLDCFRYALDCEFPTLHVLK